MGGMQTGAGQCMLEPCKTSNLTCKWPVSPPAEGGETRDGGLNVSGFGVCALENRTELKGNI